ncbi:MAG TPA: Holliday junction resolvase RuvX [Polyangiales bacterium]|jgi:putative Holliday junction resolvase
MRRLGIDLGTVRTGTAVAEDPLRVATPLCTLNHVGFAQALTAVASLIAREEIGEAVLGLPLELDGREGEAARRARSFAETLRAQTGVPVTLWDERLSTTAAERSLRSQGVRGSARRRVVDQVAATLLLQSYLDRQAASSSRDE